MCKRVCLFCCWIRDLATSTVKSYRNSVVDAVVKTAERMEKHPKVAAMSVAAILGTILYYTDTLQHLALGAETLFAKAGPRRVCSALHRAATPSVNKVNSSVINLYHSHKINS